jgi:hypothetical protein
MQAAALPGGTATPAGGSAGGYNAAPPATGTPAAPTASTPSNNWLSTLGTGIGNFLQSPLAGTLGGLAAGGVGLYQAGQATQAGKAAAGQIQSTVNPAQAMSTGTYGQLTGQGTVGGPMGQAIAGQTGAAQELLGAAQQYGTGNLTSAQNQQITSQVQAQRAMVNQQLAASGNMNSSARDAAYQQIDNNAAILGQQLEAQNLQMAQGALGSVTSTYNSLLTNALNQSNLGLRGTTTAVQTQLQNDQQVSQYLQQILGGIATQLGTASGGGQVAGQGGKTAATASGAAGIGQTIMAGIQGWQAQNQANQSGQAIQNYMSSPDVQNQITASLGPVAPLDLSGMTSSVSGDLPVGTTGPPS